MPIAPDAERPSRNLRINSDRLWATLMETAAFGATERGGLNRLALGAADHDVRNWLVSAAEKIGLATSFDDMGNIFAQRAGTDTRLHPIAMGSHLDTQPTGGKFDGILGVLAGLEVLRTLAESNYATRHPLVLIDWTNEEGSRFAPAMLSSGVFAGAFEKAHAWSRTDAQGVTLRDALDEFGWRGGDACGEKQLAAYFELHIEQGPLLETEQKTIGVVTGVQGIRWYDIAITGQEAHAGTTPMSSRKDSVLAASRIVQAANAIAAANAPHARATIGRFEASPNSRNVIAGRVDLTVDFRHPSAEALQAMEDALFAELANLQVDFGVERATVLNSAPIVFDARCVGAVRESVRRLGLSAMDIVSGAGHDAVYMSRVCPTAMIFVPCDGGLSHNELENASFEDVAAGAAALLEAVLLADAALVSPPAP